FPWLLVRATGRFHSFGGGRVDCYRRVIAQRARFKAVSSRCRVPSHFLSRAREKVTKERGTPMARPPGILPCGCAGGFRGFPTAHPCTGGKLARIPASHPADFPPPTRRAIGVPGKAARSRRALGRSREAAARTRAAAQRALPLIRLFEECAQDARRSSGALGRR